ncbi:hypothetical protein [Gardnerella swidsinskii]|jgi:hypothetical protein|uniref:hypothetical protein n=1 Tax=Gardnerella TaxID=2701 RepID=UPI000E3436EB|nr:hypothetical protein CG402_00050 [Bifidobacteriaceae bacterium NR020]
MFPNNAKTTTNAGNSSANVSEALHQCSAEVASVALHHCFANEDSEALRQCFCEKWFCSFAVLLC